MDTKWKSTKPAVAFLSFLVGVTLLLYGAAATVICGVQMGWDRMADAFRGDYQDTAAFRRAIRSDLYQLLEYAVPGDWADTVIYAEQFDGTIDTADPAATTVPAAEASASAQIVPIQALPLDPNDLNLLFAVWKDGKLLASNSEDLSPDGDLPEGYDFKLYFDGEAVTIQQDGQEIDVYGDGYYRAEDGGWDVYGYRNQPTPEAYGNVTVCLAAAKEPVYYSGTSQYSGLYQVAQDQLYERTVYFWLLLFPALAGLILTGWSILWRRHKVRADQAIAWFTGRIWLEVKLLLLIPLILCGSFLLVGFIDRFYWSGSYLLIFLLCFLALLWGLYFYLNDLHYNFGHLRSHSFCAACARLFRRQELRWSVAQRMDRRAVLQFAACVPFFLFCLLAVPFLYNRVFYQGLGPILLALICLAGVALVGAQIWLMLRSRRTTADLDVLLDRIQAAGEGRLEPGIPLPEGSDLAEAAEQLDHLESGLRAALDEQMKSERMKVELIANVSHDLKTPLTSIVSYAELLRREEDLPDHVRDYVTILNEKAQRLQTMVKDVFEVSKAASGVLPVDLEPLDLAKLLRQTLADMDEAIQASAITFKVHLPDEPVPIEADGDRLYRVFQNLIGNALKYSLAGSRAYLELTVEDGRATAALRNTSRDELPRGVDFTERFVRGDRSRTDGGSGLGLSIASTFTEACGGTFSVRTEADLFTALVSFPLTDRPIQEEVL